MATQADVRQRIKNELYSIHLPLRPFVHQINGAILAGATAIVVDDGGNFAAGDIIEFEDGEQAFVLSVATNTLTVIRGWNGTTAAAQADNAVILKNPRFPVALIDDKVDETLNELEGIGIWTHTTGSFALDTSTPKYWYPLAETDLIKVITVYFEKDTTLEPVALPGWKYVEGVPSAEFTQAKGLRLHNYGGLSNGDTVYYTYRQRIDAVGDLKVRQEGLAIYGAMYKLLGTEITPRTHDPGKRTDRTVQPGQESRDSTWYLREFRRLGLAEQAALKVEERRMIHSTLSRRAQRWQV